MTDPADMIMPMLREMRAEHATFPIEMLAFRDETKAALKNIRSALAGDTVFSRMLVGEYEERLDALERKVKALESQT